MKSKNNIVKGLLLFVVLSVILESGCAMFKKRPLLVPRDSGDTLVEITDPKQLPKFEDDYNRDTLLRSVDYSLEYFKGSKQTLMGFAWQDFHTKIWRTP